MALFTGRDAKRLPLLTKLCQLDPTADELPKLVEAEGMLREHELMQIAKSGSQASLHLTHGTNPQVLIDSAVKVDESLRLICGLAVRIMTTLGEGQYILRADLEELSELRPKRYWESVSRFNQNRLLDSASEKILVGDLGRGSVFHHDAFSSRVIMELERLIEESATTGECPVGTCQECLRPFIIQKPGQIFCSHTHAHRVGSRRRYVRKPESEPDTQKALSGIRKRGEGGRLSDTQKASPRIIAEGVGEG